jgi:Transposase DDE domain
MHVDRIPNRTSPPAYLLRETYREGHKVKKRTLANISHWPIPKIEALRRVLRGDFSSGDCQKQELTLLRSLPHGHVAAALGMLRKLKLDRVLSQGGRHPSREVSLSIAMIVARLLDPVSKLATARLLDAETANCSLGAVLGFTAVDEQELYDALDWLVDQQERIENALARRHLKNGTLVLYDVTSTYFEGRTCPLAQFGHDRDGKGKLQIVFGLLCTAEGCPVAVEVFQGNVGDPSTLESQISKLKGRFALERVVLVGDRGMITEARLNETIKPAGLDWITALRAPAIRGLVEAGAIQLSLFDQCDLAEISSPDYPGERLVVCRNPLLAEERARKRHALLDQTEKKLLPIQARVRRAKRPLRGKDKIALAVGAVINRYKMAKHFDITISDDDVSFKRNVEQINAEAALDGIYVVRTSVSSEALDASLTVKAYKQLSNAERAFRSLKTIDIEVRPIHHRHPNRVRAHVFLCMLAYYVEWHMRQALKPILFDDHDKVSADAARTSIVAKAKRSEAANAKAATKRTDEGLPVHSFQSLLGDLTTITHNIMALNAQSDATFTLYPQLTEVQARAFQLLGVAINL